MMNDMPTGKLNEKKFADKKNKLLKLCEFVEQQGEDMGDNWDLDAPIIAGEAKRLAPEFMR